MRALSLCTLLSLSCCGSEPVAEPPSPRVPAAVRTQEVRVPEREPPAVVAAPERAGAFLGGAESDDAWMDRVRALPLVKLKPIGTTSVVFKATLGGDVDTAFRPRTRQSPRGWLAEVAAYRIARALGMDEVPPAFLRTIPIPQLRGRIDPDFRQGFPEFEAAFIGDGQGGAPGVMVKWVPGMQDAGLDTTRGVTEWAGWLAHGSAIPDDKRDVARDLAELVFFDYLIGNIDRWSGGNVEADATGHRVVVRDHNLAFLAPMPTAQHDRALATMQRAERVSVRFLHGLRALDEPTLRAKLAEEAESARYPLLDDAQIAGVMERRATILSRIGALIDAYGSADVLSL